MEENNKNQAMQTQTQIFDNSRIRSVWDRENEKWYFAIVDVVAILTENTDIMRARKYWNKLKQRLKEEGNETVTNCHQLKFLAADGKMRLTDVGDVEQILRLIQYNGQAFLDRKILPKSVFYRSMSIHAVSPVFPNLEFS